MPCERTLPVASNGTRKEILKMTIARAHLYHECAARHEALVEELERQIR